MQVAALNAVAFARPDFSVAQVKSGATLCVEQCSVDTKTDALIRQDFKNYISQTTKIIIAQRIASVQDADKIIVLNNGKIVNIGNHDELMQSSNIYQELYYSQNKIEQDKKEVK